MIWLTVALILFIFQFALMLAAEYRRPAKAVAWLTLMFAFPLVGGVFCFFAARDYRRRKDLLQRKSGRDEDKLARHGERDGDGDENALHRPGEGDTGAANGGEGGLLGRLLHRLPEAALTAGNEVEVLSSAEDMFRKMLADVEAARDHVHMLYYIWNDDGWGRTFRDALIRKAKEGVEVRVIYDGIGAYSTPETFWEAVRSAGGEVHAFLPVPLSLLRRQLNYRNHRKLTVVDGSIGYVGGINIGDEYTGADRKLGYWRDTAVRLRGGAARELQRTFLADWGFVSGQWLVREGRYFPECRADGGERVLTVPDGPDGECRAVFEMMFAAIVSAEKRVYATTPYFIPDRGLLAALTAAARSGADVRIIIPGVADTQLSLWATLSYVEEMLRAGVRVYRYRKGFLHAKTLIVDDRFAATGSANMDLRSLFGNFELHAAMFDEGTVARFAEDFLRDLADSEEVRLAAFAARGRRERLREAAGRLLAPLL